MGVSSQLAVARQIADRDLAGFALLPFGAGEIRGSDGQQAVFNAVGHQAVQRFARGSARANAQQGYSQWCSGQRLSRQVARTRNKQ